MGAAQALPAPGAATRCCATTSASRSSGAWATCRRTCRTSCSAAMERHARSARACSSTSRSTTAGAPRSPTPCAAWSADARAHRPRSVARSTSTTLVAYLYTAGQPDPDLLIRTSGEMRISNFLLWQIAYAEIWVTDVLWPDFRRRAPAAGGRGLPEARAAVRRDRRPREPLSGGSRDLARRVATAAVALPALAGRHLPGPAAGSCVASWRRLRPRRSMASSSRSLARARAWRLCASRASCCSPPIFLDVVRPGAGPGSSLLARRALVLLLACAAAARERRRRQRACRGRGTLLGASTWARSAAPWPACGVDPPASRARGASLLLLAHRHGRGHARLSSRARRRPPARWRRWSRRARPWEGCAGGLAGGVAGRAGSWRRFGLPRRSRWHALVLGPAVAAAWASLGDLVESLLKRWAGVKDSRHPLPRPRRHARPARQLAVRRARPVLLLRLRAMQRPATGPFALAGPSSQVDEGPLHPRLHRLRRHQRRCASWTRSPTGSRSWAWPPAATWTALAEQVARYRPRVVSVATREAARGARAAGRPRRGLRVGVGDEGMVAVATHADSRDGGGGGGGRGRPGADLPGAGGGQGRGPRQQGDAGDGGGADGRAGRRRRGGRLLPIDSEHCALHQCLDGRRPAEVARLRPDRVGRPVPHAPARDASTRVTPRGGAAAIPPGPWAARSPSTPRPS